MGSTRIKGDALQLTLDGTGYWQDCSSVVIDQDDDGTVMLFSGVSMSTNKGWHMDVTAVQSTAEGSLWRLLWENGEQWVPYVYSPHGNTAPTANQPQFTGNLWLPRATTLGGEASTSADYLFAVTFPLDARPTIQTNS